MIGREGYDDDDDDDDDREGGMMMEDGHVRLIRMMMRR